MIELIRAAKTRKKRAPVLPAMQKYSPVVTTCQPSAS